jgi:hypothetical protein
VTAADPAPRGTEGLDAAMADPSCALFVARGPDRGPSPVLVCFGSLTGRSDVAPFEFGRQTDGLGVPVVFVRDLGQCWYQRGLPGTADGIEATASHLATVLAGLAPTRTVFVGNSSGGFAAVLFGVLCGADEMVAFGPQASITRTGRLRIRERRWTRQVRAGRRATVDRDHVDLVRLLRRTPHTGRITVHHGRGDVMDTRAARLLGRAPGVTVVAHPGGHLFVRKLRDTGGLGPILRDALFPEH